MENWQALVVMTCTCCLNGVTGASSKQASTHAPYELHSVELLGFEPRSPTMPVHSKRHGPAQWTTTTRMCVYYQCPPRIIEGSHLVGIHLMNHLRVPDMTCSWHHACCYALVLCQRHPQRWMVRNISSGVPQAGTRADSTVAMALIKLRDEIKRSSKEGVVGAFSSVTMRAPQSPSNSDRLSQHPFDLYPLWWHQQH
jgi:hypothetical protein